jgi:hypothetical protein
MLRFSVAEPHVELLFAQHRTRKIDIQQPLAKKSTSLIHVIWVGMQPAMMRRGKHPILNPGSM